jgi:hypothetical protein
VGRHRYGTPRLVHCRRLDGVQMRLRETRPPWYAVFRLRGRHTAVALTHSGARPRPAFALIVSL